MKSQTKTPSLAVPTRVAWVVAAAAVIARATISQSLRQPFSPAPGLTAYPHGAGPSSELLLDLLSCVPALMILWKRITGQIPAMRIALVHIFAGLLGVWTAASVIWAADKFAAAVGAADLVAAFALMWAVSQATPTWPRFRAAAAICFGLLLVYLAQAFYMHYVELPDAKAYFEKHLQEILQERGWKEGDFAARQFEKMVVNGELLGFNTSPNSFAAAIVLLLGVGGGLIVQRIVSDGREIQGMILSVAMAVAVPVTFWGLYLTKCKAAFVTPVLIGIFMLIAWRCARFLRRPGAYYVGLIIVLLAMAGVIACGVVMGRLPSASLNFRWRYWVAARALHHAHPFIGVGWANFGLYYLHYRLPQAAEEIQDPHNFLLRFLTELGMVGFALAVAWLGRLWWEICQPTMLAESRDPDGMGLIGSAIGFGMVLNILASVDFSQASSYITVQLILAFFYACLFFFGAAVAGVRLVTDSKIDDRPAPWVLYAALASLGAFLIHNLIEFSLFEPGPLMIFAFLAGSCLGIRRQTAVPVRAGWPMAELAGATVVWLAAFFWLVIPTIAAEALAQEADDDVVAGNVSVAAGKYMDAFLLHQPLNADYAARAAETLAMDHPDPAQLMDALNKTIAANLMSINSYLTRAQLEARAGNATSAKMDMDRALYLNPTEVSMHLQYADLLMRLHQFSDAAKECEQALKFNELLPIEEPKRLNDAEIRLKFAESLLAAGRSADAREQCRLALVDNQSLGADDPRKLDEVQIAQIQKMME
jgi:tetratricopeptide (TPR) repeat protein